ncbi:uncharacterized protein [Bactrocera oleae]|uniref:uncharacterized protein n=1 Tax=Bactrocera oleae TaxID=104688 RepID=UPI00387E97AB
MVFAAISQISTQFKEQETRWSTHLEELFAAQHARFSAQLSTPKELDVHMSHMSAQVSSQLEEEEACEAGSSQYEEQEACIPAKVSSKSEELNGRMPAQVSSQYEDQEACIPAKVSSKSEELNGRMSGQVGKAHAGELDVSKAQQLLNSARLHYDRMLVNHETLLSFAKDEELEVHSAWWDVTEEVYNDLCSSLIRLRSTKGDESHAPREGNIDSSVELKLEPLHIPSFDDELHNWLAFKDAFQTLVHNRELPTAYKLGRYMVRLLMQANASPLGDSYSSALRQFYRLDRRLASDTLLRNKCIVFMKEYIDLGHMEALGTYSDSRRIYHIPHHAVLDKFRVVFNASSPTSNGVSLNDIQRVGPTIQNSLNDILYRFRRYAIALIADVEKMFRQVLVAPEDRDLQRILWRESPNEDIKIYQLTTVTYGMACSPYNAVRALQQCVIDNYRVVSDHKQAESARTAILSSFYVDDFLTSCTDVKETVTLAQNVSMIFTAGCFRLRKWNSNRAAVLAKIGQSSSIHECSIDVPIATVLGLRWGPHRHLHQHRVTTPEMDTALELLIRIDQANAFPQDLHCLRESTNLSSSSPLLPFNPYLDDHGIIRTTRVCVSWPFLVSGVDYCGPFSLHIGTKRSRSSVKTYLSVFVCMATKAVHIELVDDLSSMAFIDDFTRFVSRRGLCRDLYSDNATTFVGANRTLATRIEACLNSRPLIPLTDDPEDKYALTLGEFLIGAPLIAVPEPTVAEIPVNQQKHWQWLRLIHQQFWHRWSEDYLATLQTRSKWRRRTENIHVGDIVLVRHENLPPTHWRLGRITEVHPGRDGLVRNATLVTSYGVCTRAVHKLSLLLQPDDYEAVASTAQDV